MDALLSRWANTSERMTHLVKVTQQVGLIANSSCLASHSTISPFPFSARPQTAQTVSPEVGAGEIRACKEFCTLAGTILSATRAAGGS